MRVPNVDFIKLPEFREIVRNNQTNVPDISDLPDTPDDVRSKESWDEQAGKLLGLREEFMIPQSAEGLMSADDIDAEFEQRKIRAQAYKLDDP